MVPNGWEVTTLGEHVDISSGYSPSKYVLAESGSFPFVKVEDMNNCAKYQSISRTYTETNGSPIGKGAVIFPKRGAAIMNNKVRITDVPMYLDTNMMALTPKKSVFSEYLYYTLIKEKLHKIADTSTIPQINNKHILPYRFKLPPLPEQRKIAQILSTWDRAIATTEKLIDASKQQKKALMQQSLTGKKRLVNPETGKAFEGDWERKRVGDVTKKFANKNKESANITVFSVTNNAGFVKQNEHFSKEVASEDRSTYKIVQCGDFAYNPARINVGSIARFDQDIGIISSLYVCFQLSASVQSDFFLQWLSTEKTIFDYSRYGEGSVRVYLWYEQFSMIEILLPSLDEQQKIASVLTAADKEIELLEAKLVHFKQEKKALMQQLLTGKRRVKVAETEAA
ncbi:restriction endonuclease subunit S [Vibrio rotiferianus]|uniref:restriction endonuclease subunit S n=1 Tax=Vibrio rotiferianus TaxID=190895 RepID=UPI000B59B667|nr:restriction endonuclease subunit S [Vibrio rotiferianus]ASI96994.1 hypothetical protein BSZ04_18915 [Vibrio rotiferianus]